MPFKDLAEEAGECGVAKRGRVAWRGVGAGVGVVGDGERVREREREERRDGVSEWDIASVKASLAGRDIEF